MQTFGISLPEEDIDLPKLYWIPKFHKNPYTQRYIAGLQKYCDTAYARSSVNQTCILKKLQRAFRKLKGLLSSFRQQYTIFLFFIQLFLMIKKGKRKVQGVPQLQTAALPRHQEEGNRQIQTSTNQTNVRKALRVALSSPSEVIAMLKGLKNTRTK